MIGNETGNSEHLIRSELWSSQLKEILTDEMMAQSYVTMLSDFPDGEEFTIPSIGQAQVDDYAEGDEIQVRPMDTGEYKFRITEYLSSGSSITEKNLQDAFYAQQLVAKFLPEQERAIMKHFETTTMAVPEAGVAANSNEVIDGIEHRWAAGGTGGDIQVQDFARARYALKMANVPDTNLVAIVDPSVEYTLNTLSNLVDVSNNPRWEGIVSDGIATGMKFVKNVYGFDVYTSNYLKDVNDAALPDRDDTAVDFSTETGKANVFFSAAAGVSPFIGAWRQPPKVDYLFRPERQRHDYMTTARYGVQKYRPENLVVVPSKINV